MTIDTVNKVLEQAEKSYSVVQPSKPGKDNTYFISQYNNNKKNLLLDL